MLARMGGDEFAVMITEVSRRAEASAFARQLLALFAEPFTVQKRQVHVSASMGISYFPEHGHTVEVLMRKADLALYLAKMEGRNTFRMVDESAEIDLLAQMQLEVDLRQALERGELSLNFQPIASASNQKIYAVEALLRWTHPTLGLISPSRFIPLAEISDTILPIGRWVALEACRQAQLWREAGIEIRVAINVSPRQFEDDNFLAGIDHALTESGLPASALEIEVTESLLIRDIEQKAGILNHLNARGVRLAIDDFGTGFSSLHHLQKLPIDTLKIDQSFIADLDESKPNQSERASAIIRAISQMAHSLDMQVVAEGIETRHQLERVQALECDAVQGYLIGKPMAQQDIETLMRANGAQR
jgi:predicted signal transduction protein with EAL and GGDEF domain